MYWVDHRFQTELSPPCLEKTCRTSNGDKTVDDIEPLDLSLPNRSRVRDNSQKDCPEKSLDHSVLQRNMLELTSTGSSDSFRYSPPILKKADVLYHDGLDKTTSTRLLALLSQADVVSSHEDHQNSYIPLLSPISSLAAHTSCFTVIPSRFLDDSNTPPVTSVALFSFESNEKKVPRLIPTIDIISCHPIGMQTSYGSNGISETHTFLPSANVTWTPSSRTIHRPSPYQNLSLPLKYPYSNNLIPSWSEMGCEWLPTGQKKQDKSLPLTTNQQLPITLNTDNRLVPGYQTDLQPSLNQGNVPKNISFLYTYSGVATSSISATNMDQLHSTYDVMDNNEHRLITKYSDNIGQSIYHSALVGFPSGLSSDDLKQDLPLSNAFNNPFLLCPEARMPISGSQITYPNFKLLSDRPNMQNKSMPGETFTNPLFQGIQGSLSRHVQPMPQETDSNKSFSRPQENKLSSSWSKTKDIPRADLIRRNNSETFSRQRETEFSFIERKHRRRSDEHYARPIKHPSNIGYPNFARIPPALRENQNQSSVTFPSEVSSNTDFELKMAPSNQTRRTDTETSYDEHLLNSKSHSGRSSLSDRTQDTNYMTEVSRATDVLNSQTSCSSLTALNQQLQRDKPMAGVCNTFGNYVHERNSHFVDTIKSQSENSPIFFLSSLNKQAPGTKSPCQERKEIFKCDKTDQENDCQKLMFESNKVEVTVTNRNNFKVKHLLSRPDRAKPALENRLPTEKNPRKCTSSVACDIPVACRSFRQTTSPSNHNSLIGMETITSPSERSFATSAKSCKENSNVYKSKSKEACHGCSAIKSDICSYHVEDAFHADQVEYSLGHTSETSALSHLSSLQDLNSSFINKNQRNATKENMRKVSHPKAFRDHYQEATAAEKSNQTVSVFDCSYKLDGFVKGQEAEMKLHRCQSYFNSDTVHSTANPETRHYVQVTTSTKSHPYQCKVCNSCCLTFSALLQHQSSGCFAALPNFVEAHASDCLGKHGRYDKSIPGDKCECTPCSLCGGIFSSKFKVFSHFKRGCYRPREKVGCEKQSKAASPYNDLANTTRSQEKLFKMKCKGKSKANRKSASTFSSFSMPKSQELKRTDIDEGQGSAKIWNQSTATVVQKSGEMFKFHEALSRKSTLMSTVTLRETQCQDHHCNHHSISNDTESRNASSQVFSQERDSSVADVVSEKSRITVSQKVARDVHLKEGKDTKVLEFPRSSNVTVSRNSSAIISKDYKEVGNSIDSTAIEDFRFIGKTFSELQRDRNDFMCQTGEQENGQEWETTVKRKMIERSNSLTKKSSCTENKAEAKNSLMVTIKHVKDCDEIKTEQNGSGQIQTMSNDSVEEKINKTDGDKERTKSEEKMVSKETSSKTKKITQKPETRKILSEAADGVKVQAEFNTSDTTMAHSSRSVFTTTTAFKPCQTSVVSLNKVFYSKQSSNQVLSDPSDCSSNMPPIGRLQFHSLDDTHVQSSIKRKRTLPYDTESNINVVKKIRKNEKTYTSGNAESEI